MDFVHFVNFYFDKVALLLRMKLGWVCLLSCVGSTLFVCSSRFPVEMFLAALLTWEMNSSEPSLIVFLPIQSNLDYPDLDYPDFSIIRTFSLVSFFFMNINKLWSQKLSVVKNV